MEKKFEIQLPFFAGFYETPYLNWDWIFEDIDDESNKEYWHERFDIPLDKEIDDTWVKMDSEYYKEVCETFCIVWKNHAPEFVEEVEFSELVSPRYYNFETDKIYANITMTDDWREQVLKFMEDNKEWLKDKIREDWSSRDGFMSFMSNDYDEWVEEIKKDEPDVRYISSIISYIMSYEYKQRYSEHYGNALLWDLCNEVMEEVDWYDYVVYNEYTETETPNIGVG